MQRPQRETPTLNDILITEELSRRSRSLSEAESPRSPNLLSENQALHTLARQLVHQPETIFQSIFDIAVDLCNASSAGVSLLETTPDGEEIFRWNVLAGTLAQYVGNTTPRHFSPCGVCLDRGTPQLFSHPERYFTYFQATNAPFVEVLVLPLIADNYALGTIWIVSHDEQRHFDSEDVRVLTSLADFTAAALLLKQRQTQELLAKNAQLEAQIALGESEERLRLATDEAQLREAQRRLELSLTGANLGVWTYNVSTDEFWADDRAKQMHGHAPHEVHNFVEAGANIHPKDRDRARAAIAQAILDRSKLQIEYRVIWGDGSVRWIASYAEFIPTGERDLGMFYGVVQDISDRFFAETALRESEARLRALIENLPGGAVFVVDRDLRYLLAQGEALSAAGFKSEDLVGRTIFEVLPPELAADYEPLYRRGLAGESFEREHNAHDRSYISRGTPLRSPNGEVYAVLAVSYDISDRKRAEATLRESEARQAFLLKLSDVLRFLADPVEIQAAVAQTALNYYEADRCYYCEIADGNAIIRRDATREDLPSVAGVYPLSSFAIFQAVVDAGRPFIVRDVHTTDLVDEDLRQLCIQLQVISFVDVPVIKNGKPVGILCLVQSTPRDWTDLEVELAVETVDRTWAAVERARAEAALAASEEKYRSLFETIGEGFCIFELIDDETKTAIDYRFLEVNQVFERQTGLENAVGKLGSEIAPNTERYWLEAYDKVARTGEPLRLENYNQSTGRWYVAYASRIGGAGSRQVCTVFDDITDRKRTETNLAFLAEISQDLVHLTNIDETMEAIGAKIGGHFHVARVIFSEISEDQETGRVSHEWHQPDLPDMKGTYATKAYFSPEFERLHRAGDTAVVHDTATDQRVDGERYAALSVGAFAGVPLIRQDKWRFYFSLLDCEPRNWRDDDIELMRELTTRIWTRLERARAEEALRESEEKYRVLFETMDEGYLLSEVIFDENGKPIDILYLEANPAAVRLAGRDFSGQRMREIDPNYEEYWYEIYGRVALTGEFVRAERYAQAHDRWFDFYAFKVGGQESRRVAVVFNDITDRKRFEQRQAYMLQLSDALRSLFDAVEIQATVTRTTMNFFKADRCYYCEIIDGDVIIRQDASREDLPSVVGVYPLDNSPIFKAMLNAGEPFVFEDVHTTNFLDENLRQTCLQLQIIAGMNVPAIKQGEPVGILCITQSTPRNWTEFEMDLAQETAERTWATIERARAEAALRESEGQLRAIYDGTREYIGLLATDGTLHRANRALLEFGGNNEEEVINKPFWETVWFINTPGMPEAVRQRIEAAAKGEFFRTEMTLARPTGELRTFDFSLHPIKNERGEVILIVPEGHDITDRKRAEAALRDSEARRYLALEAAELGTFLYHPQEDRGEPDARMLALFGLGEGDTLNLAEAIANMIHPDDRELYAAAVATAVNPNGDGKFYAEIRVLHPDKSLHWVAVTAQTVFEGEPPQPVRMYGIAADITDRKQAEADRIQLIQEQANRLEAERMSQMKDEFVAMISHELQSPMVAVLGWTRLLRANLPPPAMLMKHLETIERNAMLQAKLIQDLLDISRISAGKLRLRLEPVELESAIETAIAAVSTAAIVKNISIQHPSTDRAVASVLVMGDRDRLQQVFCNLLTNAIKFTPEGGSVTVELSTIKAEQPQSASMAEIRFVDTGIGISADFLPHVFDRFHQAEKSGSAGGLGLGLAIARHLVELHNGTIYAESAGVGQGATFIIKIPLFDKDETV